MEFRIGTGYDIHRLVEGRKLILGGIQIPHTLGCLGHSDGDALSHAIADAILGATAMGDIGQFFPDTDENIAGISSLTILSEICSEMKKRYWRIVNIDSTVVIEKPKLAGYIPDIKKKLVRILGIPEDAIGVKAKTGEGLGPVGENKCVEVFVSVLLQR